MRGLKLLAGLLAILALSGCSDVFFRQPYRVVLEPNQLGYEVDDQGEITVVGNEAYVEVNPGAPGGRLERYEYVVLDGSGNPVLPGILVGSGDVGVEVPPGREEVGGQVVYRAQRSQPFRFGLDATAAVEHLNQGSPPGWRYRVTWYVRTSNGQVVSWEQEYQIKHPQQ
ncbi:putative lipoprotein [Thermus thermophilus SG0.5JP17-16]|uniref:Putative lipoprotein n=1 Tax=Thermus thermophilus (strain SG0.5JP17-16) TaxID=762633 RepID=F6DEL6_THETG|nr:hypothetical protein [Thermus thermophilus]AEG34069.1 putative lipoprotein [Thermus thermophilus SG0.5JP17-16]